ncbi:DUF4347 domain-containing protein [Nostoc sp. FACHB-110]|uniref:DUF4347 domain-containing protein n=1 Tax=Nostoc sp. FACHB-110 TaxID=2692834 RepID=UPI0016829532|nr:DUF4347 domain-containing protein [Nostoc sp. FACHB-110]MBD2435604.1 DUF4347 domain-containing protein [Nostoc sp. FACHB-110]
MSSIVFIDSQIPDYQSLVDGLDADSQLIILDPNQDGVAQITAALQAGNFDSVHIVSHGTPGNLQLGTAQLNVQTITTTYSSLLQQWSNHLTPGADILLYGCNVAQGESGQSFVQQLHEITGADIAASDNATGSVVLGGDWNLEYTTGLITAPLAFQIQALEAYNSVLAPFTGGNIVVLRLGTGTGTLSSAATPVFLDEYTTNGTLSQSIALPTAVSGNNRILTQSGTATSEGALTLSADGRYLTLVGYDAAPGTTGVASTTSSANNRIVARVDANGTVDTTTRISSAYSGNNIRSAVTNDGSGFWVGGPATGLTYVPYGSTGTSTTINGLNSRVTNIFNGQLYTSASSGSNIGVSTIGIGLPTTSGQTVSLLPGLPNTGNPYAFVLLDRDLTIAGVDTLYIADQNASNNGGGLYKYSFNGATWNAQGSIAGTLTGLTGVINGSGVDLYATNGTGVGNTLVRFTDTAAFNANISGSFTTLATAAANTVFRGVAFAPTNATPLPDLTVSLSDSPDPVIVGNPLTYTLIVSNVGAANANNVTVQYTLPNGVTFNGTSVSNGFTASQSGNIVAFTGGSINAGSNASLTVSVIPNTSGILTSGTATVDINNNIPESNENNNTGAAITTTVTTTQVGQAPTIVLNTASTTDLLDANGALPIAGLAAVSGVINNPNDPARTLGLDFTIADADTDIANLTVTVSSSNTAVVPNANLTLTGSGASRNLRINPVGVGNSNIIVTVSDGSSTANYTIAYAASANNGTTTTQFLTGTSDASTAISVGGTYFLAGDDENQVLRLYDYTKSGLPVGGFDFTSSLGLTQTNSSGILREVDIEASTRVGDRIFWLGSESNNDEGSNRPNRNRIFATDITGTGATATLTYAGRYDFLRQDIINWDVNNLHGKGANYYGLAASAATGVGSKVPNGYNIEGLEIAPDGTTAYVAFRAPQVPPSGRSHALIVPVTNFTNLLSPTGGTQGSAQFGTPIELDLGGRGIREIRRNANNQYVIIAGPAGDAGSAPNDFRLYTWDGNPNSTPQLRAATFPTGFNPEGMISIPDNLTSTSQIQFVNDDGDLVLYNNATATKDLAENNYKKFRTDSITLGGVVLTPRIHDIQGTAHISLLNGQSVADVPGIVTVVRSNGFYLQDPNPDNDDRTSEAIFVFTSSAPTVRVGDSVLVAGTVTEFRPGSTGGTNNLTTTEIISPRITVLSQNNSLPTATILGNGGRIIPTTVIEDDANGNVETGGVFDPANDGLDFYESLEGMLVQINNPVAVSPTNSFGEIWVLGDNGVNATGRTPRGGIVISPNDSNPERIQIDDTLLTGSTPQVSVGATFDTITGVVDYNFGNFEVLPTALTVTAPSTLSREVTNLTPTSDQLTVATFNVENLDPGDGATQFANLADRIVHNLRSPDILGVEEIQDNNGATNNSVVDASVTYQTLIEAIVAAGGPRYEYRQVDPVNNQDGGEPGGNIRQGFLFNPTRVQFVDIPGGGSITNTTVTNVNGVPTLSASPGRLEPTNSAFNSSRKPLIGQFVFNGQNLYIIGNHFNSKGGDQPLYGVNQPPVLSSEVQRQQQATIVANFVQQILGIDSKANVVVLGDLNDYQFSNPLNILKSAGLTALIETLPANERYTYNFEGNAQVLDHILVSNNLLNKLDGFDVVHINSEFVDQVSDHDPGIARFNLRANQAPTAVTFNNALTSINENTSTSDRIRVADISITDDALGTNNLSLTGTDASFFEITNSVLYLRANTNLDFETKSSYSVTVAVDDPTVGSTPDAVANFTLAVNDVNEAPTAVNFRNTVTSINENTNTSNRIRVADISITDDALGTNNLSLTGTDASFFEITNSVLYLRANTNLDFETKSSYNVTVAVDDPTVGSTPDAVANFTLAVNDVNEAPTAVNFRNTVTSINENTNTSNRIRVADISITDDALGTNNLSLTGTDASFFEITNSVLYLRANTNLDFETKSSYNVTVAVDDPTVGSTPDATANFTLAVNDVNEAPTARNDSATTTDIQPVIINVLANDTDPDGNLLTISSFTNPTTGSVVRNNDNTFTYTPRLGFSGADSFTYTINDGSLTATATVNLTLTLGSNQIIGTAGNDILLGTGRSDIIRGLGGSDIISSLGNKDIIYGGDGNDSLDGGAGDDILYGENGKDILYGGDGNDTLDGGTGDDILYGGAGNDILIGGLGRDILMGGDGRDSFYLNNGSGNTDTVMDFAAGESLIISKSEFSLNQALGTLSPSFFRLGTSATTASDRFIYDGSTGKLFFDQDGIGNVAKVQIAQFANKPILANTDFSVIA